MFNSNPKTYNTLDEAIAEQNHAEQTRKFLKNFWIVYASAAATVIGVGYVRSQKES